MNARAFKNATDAGERLVGRLSESKENMADAWEDGTQAVKQFIKRTRGNVEDLLDDATRNIKRNPLGSVTMAFGAGLLLGFVVSRSGRR